MSRWRELAEKRRRAHAEQIRPTPMPAQQSPMADSQVGPARAPDLPVPELPKLPKIITGSTFGIIGNSGTADGHENECNRTVDLAALWPLPLRDDRRADALPDPTGLMERAAVLEVDGMPRHEADSQVLSEVGYASWDALAGAWRDAIGRSVAALPSQGMKRLSSRHLTRMIVVTGEFCADHHFPSALADGWALEELFGVDPIAPLVRLDRWGLIPTLALGVLPAQVLAIHCDAVELGCGSGVIQHFYRPPVLDGAVLWWRIV